MKGIKKLFMTAAVTLLVTFSVGGALTLAEASASTDHSACDTTNYCLVCDVANKINDLPEASEITLDNAAEVIQKIHDIDRIKFDLTDEEFDELSTLVSVGANGYVYKYYEAIDAIHGLNMGVRLTLTKSFDLGGEAVQDTSETEVAFSVTNLDTGYASTFTMFDLGASTSALGADYYEMTSDGWAYQYLLPSGRYEVKEVVAPATVNGKVYANPQVSMQSEEGVVEGNSAIVTLKAGDTSYVVCTNTYTPTTSYKVVDELGADISEEVVISGSDLTGTLSVSGEEYLLTGSSASGTLTVESVPTGYCLPETVSWTLPEEGSSETFGNWTVFSYAGEMTIFVLRLTEHDLGTLVAETPAGCESTGFSAHYQCAHCDEYFDENQDETTYDELVIPATGHSYGEWTETIAPTEDAPGEKQRECSVCHEIETEAVPKLAAGKGTMIVLIMLAIVVVAALMFVMTKKQ